MKRILLFSDSQILKSSNEEEIHFINTSELEIKDVLIKAKDYKADILIIYAESRYKNSLRSEAHGIELFKHIRLTPELQNLNKLPVVLLHWQSIDSYIEKDIENIFIYSPATSRIKLPINGLKQLNTSHLSSSLSQFIYGSDKDEVMNDHSFRNHIAIEQFNQQVNNPNIALFDKELWFKKIFYRLYRDVIWSSNEKIESIKLKLNILFADDMADKWINPLKQLLPNSNIVVCKAESEIISLLEKIKNDKQLCVQTFQEKVSLLQKIQQEYLHVSDDVKSLKQKIQSRESSVKGIDDRYNESKSLEAKLSSEFNEVIQRFLASGGLGEVLLDEINTDKINEKNKKEANELSEIIRKILSNKADIAALQVQLTQQKNELNTAKDNFPGMQNAVEKLKQDRNRLLREIEQLIDLLFTPPYDIFLMDMHFSEKSEGVNLKDTVGFKLLDTINKLQINLPVVIFSASTKDLQGVNLKYRFIRNRFIKGVTPVVEFKRIIERAFYGKEYANLIEMVSQLESYSQYSGRKYLRNDDFEYDNYLINDSKKQDIKKKLSSIRDKLIDLQNHPEEVKTNQTLIEISQLLGTIQENRISLPPQSKDNSFWFHLNRLRNKIGDDENYLREIRNAASHGGQSEDWKRTITIELVRQLLTTTYKKLMLG